MSDPLWGLQQAIYTTLSAAMTPVPVLDDVPEGTTYPYVAIGDAQGMDVGSKTADSEEYLIDIHVWSTYRGRKEVRELLGQVKDALHRAPLTVAGFTVVDIRFRDSQDFLDADGVTRHAVCTFVVHVSP